MKLVSAETEIEVRVENGVAWVGGRRVPFRRLDSADEPEALEVGGEIFRVRVLRSADSVEVWCRGSVARIERAASLRARADLDGDLLSPMPGRLRRVLVKPGQVVARGEAVLVLEAMKMEHVIRAPREGKVARLFFQEGELVDAGARLAEIVVSDQ